MRHLRGLYVLASLIGTVFLAALPSTVNAQYDIRQCTWMIEQITQAIESHATKQIISLERQNLEFCKERMQAEELCEQFGYTCIRLRGRRAAPRRTGDSKSMFAS
jgi:hypothetical protein